MKPGVVLVLVSTFGLALKGIWAHLAHAEGLDVAGVLFYRSALSAPLLVFGGFLLLRREPNKRDGSGASLLARGGPTLRELLPAVALGVLFSAGMTCDFQAINRLGASVSRVVLFGFPLLVLVFESLATQRLPSLAHLVGFVIAWLGLAAVASGGAQTGGAAASREALLWGLASLVLYALYVWLSGKIARSLGSVRLTMVSQLTTGFVVVFFLLVQGGGVAPSVSLAALGWIVAMVLISTVVPYFLMMEGIRRLGSSEASLLAMGGPLVTIIAGWLALGEKLTMVQLLGAAATMAGVAVTQGIVSFRRRAPVVPG